MKAIGVVPNFKKNISALYIKDVIALIAKNGYSPILSADCKNIPVFTKYINSSIYQDSSFIIVLGGDGTILQVAEKAALYGAPILGVNTGTLGYLTDVDKKDGMEAIQNVIDGKYKMEKRMMLKASFLNAVGQESHHGKSLIALNDICVTRGAVQKMIGFDIFVNDDFVDTYKADGIIFSTPTGSTAYNLSAGGPILKPDTQMVLITPICPHDLHTRAFVISASDSAVIKLHQKVQNDALISLDGKQGLKLLPGDAVKISKADCYTTIIKTNNLGFYDILRRKMVRTSLEPI